LFHFAGNVPIPGKSELMMTNRTVADRFGLDVVLLD